MLRVFFILLLLYASLSYGKCDKSVFAGKASVEIPKPKSFFSGDPKPSPEIIDKARSLAKLNALEDYVSTCVTDRIKYDRYSSKKNEINNKINSIINSDPSTETLTQKKRILSIEIRARINETVFDSMIVGTGRTKKKLRMISLFIARKADKTMWKQFKDKVSKISKKEAGMTAEKSAATDGTTTAVNKEAKEYTKTQTGGSTVSKQQNVQENFVLASPEDLNATIQKVMADFGYKGGKYWSFARKCGAPPTDVIYEELAINDSMSDDTEADIFDAIQESDIKRCKRVNYFAIAVVTYSNPFISNKSGKPVVEASVRLQITNIPEDDFPEVIASIIKPRKGSAPTPQSAEKKALISAGKWAGQQIVDTLKSQGL